MAVVYAKITCTVTREVATIVGYCSVNVFYSYMHPY